MARGRKPPLWVTPFLRALERSGQARAAAADAGIDWSTAYGRRRAHADFAADWAEALRRFRAAKGRARKAELAETVERIRKGRVRSPLGRSAFQAPSPGSPAASPTSPSKGGGAATEELAIRPSATGAPKLVKASAGRWSRKREEAFLAELAASNNIRRACLAAGLTKNAIHARRRKDPHFAAAWAAVEEIGKVEVRSFLAEATARTFDPESLPDPESSPLPKVTVAEAIRIAELKGPPGTDAGAAAEPARLANDEEMRAALTKSLAEFGVRVEKEDEAWEALKDRGADPHRLGEVGEVVLSAEPPRTDSMTRACPHCRRSLFLAFAR
jgi:hypothetical protein